MDVILKENQKIKYKLELGDVLKSTYNSWGMVCKVGEKNFFIMDLSGSGGFFGSFESLEKLQEQFDENMIENPNRYIVYSRKKYNLILDEK